MIRSSRGELKIQAETAALQYPWPCLYEEIGQDIVILSEYLVFELAKIFSIVPHGIHSTRESSLSSTESFTFTPSELKTFIGSNIKTLSEKLENFEPSQIYKRLRQLEKRASNGWRSYTIDYYDKYLVTKDRVDKRIILTFLGTTGTKACSIWECPKRKVEVKGCLQGKLENGNYVDFNSDFYNFLFNEIVDNTATTTTIYEQIVSIVKPLLGHYPDYKLYVSGQSTAGALAQICSFYLAYEDITSPITCISYGSPRIGDRNFLNAVQYLEQESKLRMIRVVYDKDVVAKVPSIGYAHVGFEVRLFKGKNKIPLVTYPNLKWGLWTWTAIALRNSFLSSSDSGSNRLDYEEMLNYPDVRKNLEKFELNELYQNPNIVGYEQIDSLSAIN
mmetsp:Transcript_7881/g.11928  ORF Transcript_7881/g.11928 Transcript_7881/m.11928 type:complete len:389 (+) Transcript_7881:513-1679(+)|eukprot:CAMPEP_0203674680 /NCGR_PEP_ID=MMETSP0090-20130426/16847_1 /ASSEMBLY_ACC=CAM_ASM_001088 /TAXON_ID=426623 /ORGANISM="Chaetoceros affinis, Strain CCMP159" /LENGTH=388 /DNA_ID=CAMNT_0050540621 /DNA_START=439 /DNA_END=1605 /DNA_ORIENTATION=+